MGALEVTYDADVFSYNSESKSFSVSASDLGVMTELAMESVTSVVLQGVLDADSGSPEFIRVGRTIDGVGAVEHWSFTCASYCTEGWTIIEGQLTVNRG